MSGEECPKCGGPVKILYQASEYFVVECLNGHKPKPGTVYAALDVKLHPVYLIKRRLKGRK